MSCSDPAVCGTRQNTRRSPSVIEAGKYKLKLSRYSGALPIGLVDRSFLPYNQDFRFCQSRCVGLYEKRCLLKMGRPCSTEGRSFQDSSHGSMLHSATNAAFCLSQMFVYKQSSVIIGDFCIILAICV